MIDDRWDLRFGRCSLEPPLKFVVKHGASELWPLAARFAASILAEHPNIVAFRAQEKHLDDRHVVLRLVKRYSGSAHEPRVGFMYWVMFQAQGGELHVSAMSRHFSRMSPLWWLEHLLWRVFKFVLAVISVFFIGATVGGPFGELASITGALLTVILFGYGVPWLIRVGNGRPAPRWEFAVSKAEHFHRKHPGEVDRFHGTMTISLREAARRCGLSEEDTLHVESKNTFPDALQESVRM